MSCDNEMKAQDIDAVEPTNARALSVTKTLV